MKFKHLQKELRQLENKSPLKIAIENAVPKVSDKNEDEIISLSECYELIKILLMVESSSSANLKIRNLFGEAPLWNCLMKLNKYQFLTQYAMQHCLENLVHMEPLNYTLDYCISAQLLSENNIIKLFNSRKSYNRVNQVFSKLESWIPPKAIRQNELDWITKSSSDEVEYFFNCADLLSESRSLTYFFRLDTPKNLSKLIEVTKAGKVSLQKIELILGYIVKRDHPTERTWAFGGPTSIGNALITQDIFDKIMAVPGSIFNLAIIMDWAFYTMSHRKYDTDSYFETMLKRILIEINMLEGLSKYLQYFDYREISTLYFDEMMQLKDLLDNPIMSKLYELKIPISKINKILFSPGYAEQKVDKLQQLLEVHLPKVKKPQTIIPKITLVDRLEKINFTGEIDPLFICPISQSIMTTPVLCNDTHVYDRCSVEPLVNTNKPSPLNSEIKNFQILDRVQPIEKLCLEFVEKQERLAAATASTSTNSTISVSNTSTSTMPVNAPQSNVSLLLTLGELTVANSALELPSPPNIDPNESLKIGALEPAL